MGRVRPWSAWRWGLGLGLVAAVAGAEMGALRQLRTGVCHDDARGRARCISAARLRHAAGGVAAHDVSISVGEDTLHAAAIALAIRPAGVLELTVRGVEGTLHPDRLLHAAMTTEATAAVAEVEDLDAPSRHAESTPGTAARDAAEPGWLSRALRVPRGLARRLGRTLHVDVQGAVELVHDDLTARTTRVEAALDPSGEVRGALDLTLARGDAAPVRLDGLSIRANPEAGVAVGATLIFAHTSLNLRGALRGHRARIALENPDGGRLTATLPDLRTRDAARVHAEDFTIPDDPRISWRRGDTVALSPGTMRIDGDLQLRRSGGAWRIEFDAFEIAGGILDAPALARVPVSIGAWTVSGHLERAGDGDQVSLVVTRGDVHAELNATRTPSRILVDATLAPTPCQTLLESIPPQMAHVIRDLELDGEIEGGLQLDLRWDALHEAAARELETGWPQPDPGVLVVRGIDPGACRVRGMPPSLDFEALRGAYVHRFRDRDGGAVRRRVFDTSSEDFIALGKIERIGQAFMTLEDLNFRRHDGFDREQMRRAFWHNMRANRFSRGASTISQQTSRNLWLGIDRSVGRKIQEALLTVLLERNLDKRRILELYVNLIELGPGVYGVHQAAEFYFGRPPEALNLLEQVHLASLAPAPGTYSRRFASGTVDATWRANLERQVRRMRRNRFVTAEEAAMAIRAPLRLLDRRASRPAPAPHDAKPAPTPRPVATSASQDSADETAAMLLGTVSP